MAFIKTLVIMLSLSWLLVHTHATVPRTPQARVWTMCRPTTNPLACFRTILPHVMNGRFNMYKALEIEIQATQLQVQKTASIISALLAKPPNDKSLTDSLHTCSEQYANMLDAITEAVKFVSKRDVVEARFKFSAVLSYQATCNDDFGNVVVPFAKDSQVVYDLGGNSLDLMKAIEDREARRRGNIVPTVPNPPPGGPCQGVIGTCA